MTWHVIAGDAAKNRPRAWHLLGEMARPRFVLPLFLVTVAIYMAFIHPWLMSWGATAHERQMTLPGDEFVPNPAAQSTRVITIDAPAGEVWSWLIQLGQDRGGFYSYDWLENVFGINVHSATAIRPAWQQRADGETVPLMPDGFLGVTGARRGPPAIADPGNALILKGWGAFVIQPVDDHTSRLIARDRQASANVFTTLIMDPIYATMERQTLRGIKARAEGRPAPPLVLDIPARVGWAVAGLAVAGLFFARRRRWLWLLIPVAATVPALASSHDIDAALAAFLAVGITILGALIFGRGWWGLFVVIGSAVMLALLLTPDAYLAFGWAFALIIVAVCGTAVGKRREMTTGIAGHPMRHAT
jgi:hypothetical protein